MSTNGLYSASVALGAINAQLPSIAACYRAAEFDPEDHVFVMYAVEVDATGAITNVATQGDDVRDVALDGCVMRALRQLHFGPTDTHAGGRLQFGFVAH
jgi:hypothetical protein